MSEKGFRVEIPVNFNRRAPKGPQQEPPLQNEFDDVPRIARLLALAHKWEGIVQLQQVARKLSPLDTEVNASCYALRGRSVNQRHPWIRDFENPFRPPRRVAPPPQSGRRTHSGTQGRCWGLAH